MMDKVTQAEMITFEPDCVGIFLDWQSGRKSAYSVASVGEALAELDRLDVKSTIRWKMKEAA